MGFENLLMQVNRKRAKSSNKKCRGKSGKAAKRKQVSKDMRHGACPYSLVRPEAERTEETRPCLLWAWKTWRPFCFILWKGCGKR